MSDYEIDMEKLGAGNDAQAPHEAKEQKIHNLISDGEENKVKWGELLEAFAGLDASRIKIALEQLTPCQLSSIKDGILKAEETAKYKVLESVRVKLIGLGVSPEEFFNHVKRQEERQNKRSYVRREYSQGAKDYAEKIIRENPTMAVSHVRDKVIAKFGEEIADPTLYQLRKKVKKSLEESNS